MFLLLFITLLLVIIYLLITPFGKYRQLGDQIPGPKTYPFIGDAYWFFLHKNYYSAIRSLTDKFGKVSKMWLGKQLIVVLADTYDIKYFLTSSKHIEKAHQYKLLGSWIGNGLVTAGGDVWRTHRKLLTPAFHFKILKDSFNIVANHADELVRSLDVHLNSNEPIEIQSFIEKCILGILYESAMGNHLKTVETMELSYQNILTSLKKCTIKRVCSPWLYPEFIFRFSPTGREFYRSLNLSKRVVNEIIEDRKNILSTTRNGSTSDDGTDTVICNEKRKCRSFIDILLSENNFTDQEIHDEVQTFMFAGQDTTLTAIVFCIYLLSNHLDIQRKIVEEIKSIVKDDNLTYGDLPKLKYLEKVIKESMRVYPVGPWIGRHIYEDVTLPSGVTIPADTSVVLSILSLHYNPENFNNPEIFDPEKFNEDVHREPYSFVPFSVGIRNCIGQKFAIVMMKTILSKLLMEYEILNADVNNTPLTLNFRMSLVCDENIMVKIRKRIIL